jgi:DNA-binding transcriptional MerR regulator
MESRNEMSQALEEIGLSPEVFREILQAKQDPEAESDASEEELQKFDSATQELSQIQRETQSDMKEAVESEGLEVARFQQILSAVREQPDLQKQVQQIIDNSKQ